jgi:broad specificity phosphatase PhoE
VLILVRHGQTIVNAEGRLQGRADAALTDLGQAQADAIAHAIGRPLRVISSPLLRARETAEKLTASRDVEIEIDERWIEVDYGELEGTRVGAVDPAVWQRWRSDVTWAPPGGESLADVGRRVRAACESLAAEAASRDVVVVSHVSPIKAAAAWALGVGDEIAWRMFLDVAAISRIAVGDRGPSLRSWNEGSHLADPPVALPA